ncbi:MAG: hypothetical protein IJ289_08875 [Clostridia bacterium]|nr:hypothetical protein [Clostridia bacterium]
MFKEPDYCFIGLCFLFIAGICIFELIFNKNKEFVNKKQIAFVVICVLLSGVCFLAAYLGEISLIVFSFAVSLGVGFAAIGISNIVLYKTCTKKLTATYLYSRITGKRGNSAIPVFRYNWEGEEYTCASKQQVSARLIGTKYRIDQPCQIFINPEKPKNVIVRTEKLTDEIGKIVLGLGAVAGGVCALIFM